MTISFGSTFEIQRAQTLPDKKFMIAMGTGYELSEIGIPVEQSDNIESDEDLLGKKDVRITYKTPDAYDEVLVSFLANRGIEVCKTKD